MSGTIFESRLKDDTASDTKHNTSVSGRTRSRSRKRRAFIDKEVGTGINARVSLKTRPAAAGVKHAQTGKQPEPTRAKAIAADTVEEAEADAVEGSGSDSPESPISSDNSASNSDTGSASASATKTVAVIERHKRQRCKPKMYSPGKFTEKKKRAKLIHDDVCVACFC